MKENHSLFAGSERGADPAAGMATLGFYFIGFARDKWVLVADNAEPVRWLLLVPAVLSLGLGVAGWISGPRRDQDDRLYGGNRGVNVDEDVRVEYRSYLKGI